MVKTIEISSLAIGYRKNKQAKQIGPIITVDSKGGELIALIGPNGVGKSTFLRTIAKLQDPLKGSVSILGNLINSIEKIEFASLLSFVSTENIRVPNLNVNELVSLGRFPYTNWLGRLTPEDILIVEEAISLVGLQTLSNNPINELSDGERQRAMIARALAQDTPIILLDEPTAYLDLPNKFEIVHLLGELALKKQKTIIFSTHDLNIALSEADKIWLMGCDDMKQGAPEDLLIHNDFNQVFGNSLQFDWQMGTFKKNRPLPKAINLICHDKKLNKLTANALKRLGYSISQNSSEIIEVVLGDVFTQWNYSNSIETRRFNSVYEMGEFLKNKCR